MRLATPPRGKSPHAAAQVRDPPQQLLTAVAVAGLGQQPCQADGSVGKEQGEGLGGDQGRGEKSSRSSERSTPWRRG